MHFRSVVFLILIAMTAYKPTAEAAKAITANPCAALFRTDSIEALIKRGRALGHAPENIDLLQSAIARNYLKLAEALHIVEWGKVDRFGPDAYVRKRGGLPEQNAYAIYEAFQTPYVGRPVGRSEKFLLPDAAASRLVPRDSVVTVQEYAERESIEGANHYLAILINTRPIASIEYDMKGYREIDELTFETSPHARGLGIEAALVKELLRRYPNTTSIGFLLSRASFSATPPETETMEGLQAIVSSLGYGQLKLIKHPVGADTAMLSLRR